VTLVRLHKPGEAVELTLIRESKPLTVSFKTIEKDVPRWFPMGGIWRYDFRNDQRGQQNAGVAVLNKIPVLSAMFGKAELSTTQPVDATVGARKAAKTLTLTGHVTTQSGELIARDQPAPAPSAAVAPAARMGVSVGVATEAMRSQLSLPEGVGLMVTAVDADGPGNQLIHLHDVLHKLDDQLLTNPEQFTALVRMHKPADTIQLTLIRAAKPIVVSLKLGNQASKKPLRIESVPSDRAATRC